MRSFVAIYRRGAALHHHARTGRSTVQPTSVPSSWKICVIPSLIPIIPLTAMPLLSKIFKFRNRYLAVCPNAFISTSTPGGRSSFISASTVPALAREYQPLVRAHFKLFTRFLVHVRKTQHRPAIDGGGQRTRPAGSRAGTLRRVPIFLVDWSRILWSYALRRIRILSPCLINYSMISVTARAPRCGRLRESRSANPFRELLG